jgi:hypothetical protein
MISSVTKVSKSKTKQTAVVLDEVLTKFGIKFCSVCFEHKKSMEEFTSHNTLNDNWDVVCPTMIEKGLPLPMHELKKQIFN